MFLDLKIQYVNPVRYFLLDMSVQLLKSSSLHSLGIVVLKLVLLGLVLPALVLSGPGSPRPFPSWLVPSGWLNFSPSLLLPFFTLPSPRASLLSPSPFPFTLTFPSLLPALLIPPSLVSSPFLLSVCVSEGRAPITSYLERGSCSQSGFCLLLGQVISELQ